MALIAWIIVVVASCFCRIELRDASNPRESVPTPACDHRQCIGISLRRCEGSRGGGFCPNRTGRRRGRTGFYTGHYSHGGHLPQADFDCQVIDCFVQGGQPAGPVVPIGPRPSRSDRSSRPGQLRCAESAAGCRHCETDRGCAMKPTRAPRLAGRWPEIQVEDDGSGSSPRDVVRSSGDFVGQSINVLKRFGTDCRSNRQSEH